MDTERYFILFFPTVIFPLAVFWFALRYLFDVPVEVATVVIVVLTVAAFFTWNGLRKRSASLTLSQRIER